MYSLTSARGLVPETHRWDVVMDRVCKDLASLRASPTQASRDFCINGTVMASISFGRRWENQVPNISCSQEGSTDTPPAPASNRSRLTFKAHLQLLLLSRAGAQPSGTAEQMGSG